MELRYVVYSDTAGVFLGINDGVAIWSKRPGLARPLPPAAPTYADADAIESALDMCDNTNLDDGESYRPVEVLPDLPDNYASVAACIKRLLPSWPVPDTKAPCPRCGRGGGASCATTNS